MKTNLFSKNKQIFFLIILFSVMKISLVGRGFLAFPDENRYRETGLLLKSLAQGDIVNAITHVFATQGRPGDALLKIIPMSGQVATARIFGCEIYESDNAWPLFIYNYLIYIGLLIIHFLFSNLFLKNKTFSLLSVFVFSSLLISYISLRHADPYDASLLLLYFVFYKMMVYLKIKKGSNFKYLLFGFIAFFGYLCYPGYILLFFAIPIVYFLTDLRFAEMSTKTTNMFFYCIGSVSCLLFFEMASRAVDQSFIQNSMALSTTITQGSFDECFSFFIKYLTEVENFTGFLLLFGLIAFIVFGVFDFKKTKTVSPIYILFLVLLALYFLYAALGYWGHKVVYYARLLRQFMPFLVLILIVILQKIVILLKMKKWVKQVYLSIFLLAVSIQFSLVFLPYQQVYYPKDIAWQIYNEYHFSSFSNYFEYSKSWSEVPNLATMKIKIASKTNKKLLFVNVCNLYPFDDLQFYKPFRQPNNYQLLISKPCSLNFKAYQFEGYNIHARKNLDSIGLKCMVFIEK